MQDVKKLQSEMHYQLFGRKAQRIECPKGLQVVLSVRKQSGGVPSRYVHQTKTISRLDAQMQAEREARSKGFNTHAVLYIGEPLVDINTDLYRVN